MSLNIQIQSIILMTACINPPKINLERHSIHRSNPLVRLEDYKKALTFWLNYDDKRIRGIVFIDNSNYDLNILRDLALNGNTFKRKVEFLQINASPIPKGVHYGYSELELIDAAFENSELINEYDFVIKTTGRLYFPKLTKLLNRIKPETKIMTDCRDFEFLNKKANYILTTIFVVQKDFYKKHLIHKKDKMTSHLEVLFYKILKPLSKENPNEVVIRFPINNEPVGYGAHWDISYSSYKKVLMNMLRGTLRWLIPNFYI